MEEYIEVSAKTKEEAIMNAAIQLGTSSDNIEYDVIQEATSGLFGIGRKPAIIRARKKKDISLDFEEAVRDPLKDISEKKSFMKKPAKKFTKEPVKKQPEKTVEKKEEKPVEKKPERKPENQPQSKAEKEVEVKKEEPQAKPAVTREKLPINKEAAEKDAKEFLEKMFAAMDSEVCIKTSFDKDDNLMACHEVVDQSERKCLEEYGTNLVIHLDPVITDDVEINRMQKLVKQWLVQKDSRLAMHDFRIHSCDDKIKVVFDLMIPDELQGKEEEIKESLENFLNQGEGEEYQADITFDPEADW